MNTRGPFIYTGILVILLLTLLTVVAFALLGGYDTVSTEPAGMTNDNRVLRLTPPPPYIASGQLSSGEAEVPPLPLDEIMVMAWYVVGTQIDLSKAAAAFKSYEWHESYIEGVVDVSTGICKKEKYQFNANVYTRVRSDGVIITWVPKDSRLANAFLEENIFLISAIVKVLKAAGMVADYDIILSDAGFYSPGYPEADAIVIIHKLNLIDENIDISYTIPNNVEAVAGYLELIGGCGEFDPDIGITIDGYEFHHESDRTFIYEIILNNFYPNWSKPNNRHIVALYSYSEDSGKFYDSESLTMIVFLKVSE